MRKLFLWIIFLGITLFVSMQISKEIHAKILHISDAVKLGVLNAKANTLNIFTRHFNQAAQIKELSSTLKEYEALKYNYDALKNEYSALLESMDIHLEPSVLDIALVRTISYVEINDYTKIWLDHKNVKPPFNERIFGLISDNKAAGIALLRNNRLVGYLNGNEKCSYSVKIGEKKSPGVAKYDINKGFIVDYIPMYPEIKVGDKVYTSGFDEIFYPGILVGSVESVEIRQGYQIAKIKSATQRNAQFYWLVDIDSVKTIIAPQEEKEEESQSKLFNFM